MKKLLLPALTILASLGLSATGPVLSIEGRTFAVDRQPFDMWGIRVASATQSDALTDQLIAQLDAYREHGVNSITLYLMGSSAAYSDPFSEDGTELESRHRARLERIVRACADRKMVPIVGVLYHRADKPRLRDWNAVRNAVRTVAEALRPYRHVILNIAKEQNHDAYARLPWARVAEPEAVLELCRLARQANPHLIVGAGGSDPAKNIVLGRSIDVDVLLFNTQGNVDSGELFLRFITGGVDKPMVNVEMFGAWTDQFLPAGVFSPEVKAAYLAEIERAAHHDGLHLQLHNTPWIQPSGPGARMRYDLGGAGTPDDPGLRWYFEAVRPRNRSGPVRYEPLALPPGFHTFAGDTAQPLRVSPNGRHLVLADGRPFFWLGDTSWQLLRKSRRENGPDQPAVASYFAIRQLQGFNVLQTVAAAPFDREGGSANTYGHRPFADPDCTQLLTRPGENDDYWDHADHVLALAARHGMRVALLPAWLSGFRNDHPWVLDPAKAYGYGHALGARYGRLPHLIWTLGGDAHLPGTNVDNPTRLALTRALVEGIADGANGADGFDGSADWSTTFMTFHPPGGGKSSGDHLHAEPWLDMNMIQTTTMFEFANYLAVMRDYFLAPPKPTLDSEVAYEGSISVKRPERPIYGSRRTTDWEVRKAAYWAVFAGACGHTYGHRSFISWMRRDESGTHGANSPWYENLEAPGARQMRHLRRLIETHDPFLDRVPDHELLERNPATGGEHAQVTRAADGRYALVYVPNGQPIRVRLGRLAPTLAAFWFDPRTGERHPSGQVGGNHTQTFIPPTNGPRDDWVLELTTP